MVKLAEPMQIPDDEDESVLQCVDKGLDFFGESVKDVIYWRFLTMYKSERRSIIAKPDLFRECLRDFFGEPSYRVERSVVAAIIEQFHLSGLNSSDSLARAIREAKKSLSD